MLINQDEISCDECEKRIESPPKPRGWHNPLTAEAHICSGCWDKELKRVRAAHSDWTETLREIKFPIRTFIGQAIEDDVVKQVMDKYSVS